LQQEAALFGTRAALWYLPKLTLGDFVEGGKASQGDELFVAPNPPFGAVFTYYLKDDLKTRLEQRRESEKPLAAASEDTPWPGWDALRQEEIEEPPAMVLTVSDAAGEVVRRVEGPVTAGFHRVAWDLRHPLSSPWTAEPPGPDYLVIPGPLAAPGSYSVSLAKRVDGQVTDLGLQHTFEVKALPRAAPGGAGADAAAGSLAGATPEEAAAFTLRLDDLNRQVTGAVAALQSLLTESVAIKDTLLRSRAPQALRDKARALELDLLRLQQQLSGNETRALYNEGGPVPITRRLEVAVMGTFRSTYGPTPTHRRSVEIAEAEFAGVRERLARINGEELPNLRRDLDAADVPWTPGRGVPGQN
jgi:hypothetical protein